MIILKIAMAIVLSSMLAGCQKPFIEVSVDVQGGTQPAISSVEGKGGCGPTVPWYLCIQTGGTPPTSGKITKIYGNGDVKVYEVEVSISGDTTPLYFSTPPDIVDDNLQEGDEVFLSFDRPKRLAKPQ